MENKRDIIEIEIIKQETAHIPDIIDKEYDKTLKSFDRIMFSVVVSMFILITTIFLLTSK